MPCMRPLGHYPPTILWSSINILASWRRGHSVREIAELAQSHRSDKYRNQDFTHRSISKPCSLPWRRTPLSCGGGKRLELHDIGRTYLSWCWVGSGDLRDSRSVCHTKKSGAHIVREWCVCDQIIENYWSGLLKVLHRPGLRQWQFETLFLKQKLPTALLHIRISHPGAK